MLIQAKINSSGNAFLNAKAEYEELFKGDLEDIPIEIRPQTSYSPVATDKIDCKVAEEIESYIKDHNHRLDIPFRRIKEGIYNFGTLKVITRIRYGSLIIRVGGGYSTLKEFLNTNLFTEKNKIISGPFFKDFISKRAAKHK